MDSDSDTTIILSEESMDFDEIGNDNDNPIHIPSSEHDRIISVDEVETSSVNNVSSFELPVSSSINLADLESEFLSESNSQVTIQLSGTSSDSQIVQEIDVCSNNEGPVQNNNSKEETKNSSNVQEEEDDDGRICPICFDNWTNLGEHRVCALKCGHLFGLKCIERWFTIYKNYSCPTCKENANKTHIRCIYVKRLIAVDTTELERMRNEMTFAIEKKNKMQIELTRANCIQRKMSYRIRELGQRIQYLESMVENKQISEKQTKFPVNNERPLKVFSVRSLEICKGNGCRVLDYYVNHDVVAASVKSPNALFPGYGVRIINVSIYKPTTFIPLHSKPIRDLSFHARYPWLLSASLDKVVKIMDTSSSTVVAANTSGDVPLWSCCWDADDFNMLYVGAQNGSTIKYDVRRMNEPLSILEVDGDMSPVVSVSPVSRNAGDPICHGGIISCKLNSLWTFENTSEDYVRYPIQIDGPFFSMSYNNSIRHILVSTRSNSRSAHSRHLVCNFERGTLNTLLCNTVHCFTGSFTQRFLSRSCFVRNQSVDFTAAYHEQHKSIFLWSLQSGEKRCSLPACEPVLDLRGISVGDTNFLLSLSERKLEFFKLMNSENV